MAARDLQALRLGTGAVSARVDFLESYASTTLGELEDLAISARKSDEPQDISARSQARWILTMDAASSLRDAASWALYLDVDRGIGLMSRAGFLYQQAEMAFGSFLITVAGIVQMAELSDDIELLAKAQGLDSTLTSAAIPDSLHHPQQQVYLLLSCAGRLDRVAGWEADQSEETGASYRRQLFAIASPSPARQGVLPFGALGMPLRVPWDIGVHLLQDPGPESLSVVARHLAGMCRRYAETMELAAVNEYLWSHAAAPVDVGDIEVIGITALAMTHFGAGELTDALSRQGLGDEDSSFIPVRLARELTERYRRPFSP